MNPQQTPKHRSTEQSTPTRPTERPAPKRRRSLGPTLTDRLRAARAS